MKHTHTVMAPALRRDIGQDPAYTICMAIGNVPGHECGGRNTRSHDVYVAGRKVQRKWAINCICAKGHGVDQYQDASTEIPQVQRRWIALNRATDEELLEFPRARLIEERERLNRLYGHYVPPVPPMSFSVLSISY